MQLIYLRLMINLYDNSFQIYTGFPNAHTTDIFGRNGSSSRCLFYHKILKKSTEVYSKSTLVIKTAFRFPTGSWVFSLFHRLFMKETTRLGWWISSRRKEIPSVSKETATGVTYLLSPTQTGFGYHPATYPMGTGDILSVVKDLGCEDDTRFHLVPW